MVKCVYLQRLTPAEKVPCLSSQILPSQRNCRKSSSFPVLKDASLPCAYSSLHSSPSKPHPLREPTKRPVLRVGTRDPTQKLTRAGTHLGARHCPTPYRVFKPPPLEWLHDFSPVPFPESHWGVVIFNSAQFGVLHRWRNLLLGIQKLKKKIDALVVVKRQH